MPIRHISINEKLSIFSSLDIDELIIQKHFGIIIDSFFRVSSLYHALEIVFI